mmetsp:Transcript_75288/g.244839  ORF Transcript_75288/g.244839 Transcript_75288/m.244839 type:complete len:933 (-) Transcript_75288:66-2864(-)
MAAGSMAVQVGHRSRQHRERSNQASIEAPPLRRRRGHASAVDFGEAEMPPQVVSGDASSASGGDRASRRAARGKPRVGAPSPSPPLGRAATASAGPQGGSRGGKRGTRRRHEDLEVRWEAYLFGDEYVTFSALATALENLPPSDQLSENRWDFEMLVHLLHRLGTAIGVEHASKAYRSHYSPDVQLTGYLYSTLLTAFTLLPSYVLNGQEFYVSDTVLDQCRSLQSVFLETCQMLKRHFSSLQPYSLEQIRSDVRRSLVYFDKSWCRFEVPALEEIEAIHRQACRPLLEAIEVERALVEAEGGPCAAAAPAPALLGGGGAAGLGRGLGGGLSPPGPAGARRVRLEVQRNRLLDKICELNRLANVDGKGRSDMDITCILEAERLASKSLCICCTQPVDTDSAPVTLAVSSVAPGACSLSAVAGAAGATPQVGGGCGIAPGSTCRCCGVGGACAPPVLLRVARALMRSLERLRRVLQRYAQCLYQLNSHLANNPDLVQALERFEAAWETANRYLVQPGPRRLALSTYGIVAAVREAGFQEGLASLEPEALISSVPRSLLLHEMRRLASSAAVPKKLAKADSGAVGDNGNIAHAALPRGAVEWTRSQRPPAAPSNGPMMQRSPIARAFFHADAAVGFDEAVAAIGRLSEAQVAKLQTQLLAPLGDCSSSGGRGSAVGTPQLASKPPLTAAPGAATATLFSRGGLPRTASGGAGAGGAAAVAASGSLAAAGGSSCGRAIERPPRTPCPPRMAVPNGSRPPSVHKWPSASSEGAGAATGHGSMVLVLPSTVPELEDIADDDDDPTVLSLDLTSLQGRFEAYDKLVVSTLPSPSALRCASAATANTAAAGEEADRKAARDGEESFHQVASSISTMAVHLQRAKPTEWNELIQVVLQGLLLARSSTGQGTCGARAAARGCPQPGGGGGAVTTAAVSEVW